MSTKRAGSAPVGGPGRLICPRRRIRLCIGAGGCIGPIIAASVAHFSVPSALAAAAYSPMKPLGSARVRLAGNGRAAPAPRGRQRRTRPWRRHPRPRSGSISRRPPARDLEPRTLAETQQEAARSPDGRRHRVLRAAVRPPPPTPVVVQLDVLCVIIPCFDA